MIDNLFVLSGGGGGANDAVTQTNTTDDSDYRVLLSNSASDTTETNGVKKSGTLTYNPNDDVLTVGQITASTVSCGVRGALETGYLTVSESMSSPLITTTDIVANSYFDSHDTFDSLSDIADAVYDLQQGGGGGSSDTWLTTTLTAGTTAVIISDSSITTNSVLDFYTSKLGVVPTGVTVATGSVTITFEPQLSNMGVGVLVKGV